MKEAEGIKPEGKEDIKRFSIKANVISAFSASIMSGLFFHPMDLLKIKMQQSPKSVRAIDILRDIYKEGGLKSFYKGTSFAFACGGLVTTIRMYLYSFFKFESDKYAMLRDPISRILVSSISIATITSILMTPIEHSRIRLTGPEGSLYTGSIDAVIKMYQFHGFSATHRAFF